VKKKILIAIMVMLIISGYAFAWNDTLTHPHITLKAVGSSSFDKHLQNQLMITDGKNSILNGKTILKWLEYGAEMEDKPICRATNHFHNPSDGIERQYRCNP
jgi:hypothetical protein